MVKKQLESNFEKSSVKRKLRFGHYETGIVAVALASLIGVVSYSLGFKQGSENYKPVITCNAPENTAAKRLDKIAQTPIQYSPVVPTLPEKLQSPKSAGLEEKANIQSFPKSYDNQKTEEEIRNENDLVPIPRMPPNNDFGWRESKENPWSPNYTEQLIDEPNCKIEPYRQVIRQGYYTVKIGPDGQPRLYLEEEYQKPDRCNPCPDIRTNPFIVNPNDSRNPSDWYILPPVPIEN